MGLLGYLGGDSDNSSDEDSDHGLSASEDDMGLGDEAGGGHGGGAVAVLRQQISVQAGEIQDLQERVQDLLEKVRKSVGAWLMLWGGGRAAQACNRACGMHPGMQPTQVSQRRILDNPPQVHDLREGRREAEDRLASALERLQTARGLLADHGVDFDPAAALGEGAEEEVSEGGDWGAAAAVGAAAGPGAAAAAGGQAAANGGGREGARARIQLGPADSAKSLGRPWGPEVWGGGQQPRRSMSHDWSESAAGAGSVHHAPPGDAATATAVSGEAAAMQQLQEPPAGVPGSLEQQQPTAAAAAAAAAAASPEGLGDSQPS